VRVGLDVSKLRAADGLGTFTREALGALTREADGGHTFFAYDLLGDGRGIDAGQLDAANLIATAGTRPAHDGLNVFVATTYSVPRLSAGTHLLFVAYDVTFLSLPDCHTTHNRVHCLAGLVDSLALDADLLAISHDGARDLGVWLGRSAESIPVLPLAPAPAFRRLPPEATARQLLGLSLQPGSYILSVGSLEPRKNIATLLDAHAALPDRLRRAFPLVLAGPPGWRNEALTAALDASAAQGDVRRLGSVDRDTLVALYNGAAIFVYPSLAEGYGLPVVEAMACGAPVVTSNLSALPETAGGAARLVDPRDTMQVTAALVELLDSDQERQRLRVLGLDRVAGLSWQDTARALLARLERQTGTRS
jgi:alpha-1,3-rhamnosyl/mannosyltransferase